MAQAERTGAGNASAAGERGDDASALTVASAPFGQRIDLRGEAIATALRAAFEEELVERRAFLWLPVLFGAGILGYFALPREPFLLPLLGVAILAALAAWRA
jgi:competence protein ComEC